MEEYVILRSPSPKFSEPGYGVRTLTLGGVSGGDIKVETAKLSKTDIMDLHKDPDVQSFAPVMRIKLVEPVARDISLTAESNETWGVRAVAANVSPFTGKGVKVAVLDTGIDAGHPAFAGKNIMQKDFTGEGDGDGNGHGTHCAGTIFGQPVGGLRIGVAPGIDQALIGKVLGTTGGGTTGSIVQAIEWALDNGANVISMSLGMDFPGYVESLRQGGFPGELATSKGLEAYHLNANLFSSLAELAKSRAAFFQGTMFVAASGNESRRDLNPDYEIAVAPPAAGDGFCAVGALEQTPHGLKVAYFSNTKVNVSAPGVGIFSARVGGGLTAMSGTSMATPHVAGVACLWADKLLRTFGKIDPVALAAKLMGSCVLEPLTTPVDQLDVGTGIVQAPQA
jgi:subtilisin family serine protease